MDQRRARLTDRASDSRAPTGGAPNGGPGAGRRSSFAWPGVRVTTAAEARALDDAAIARGIPSRALMRAAGHAAACEITRRYAHNLARGVAVYAGPGNNGGDAWVVAGALKAAGIAVSVRAVGEAKTEESAAERVEAELLELPAPHGGEEIVVDGLLGVGARGAPKGEIADAIAEIRARRARGAIIVALDVPSGLDASSGETFGDGTVQAHCTICFGTLKRGALVARAHAGAIVVLDIGLGVDAMTATIRRSAPDVAAQLAPWVAPGVHLADAHTVHAMLPRMAASSHKGTRGKVLIVGGASGMSGAVILAARGALAAGAGLVKVCAHASSLGAVSAAVPQALTTPWPENATEAARLAAWADAMVIGPGFGPGARVRVLWFINGAPTSVVLDADALNAFPGESGGLGRLLAGREALITPHPLEYARLLGGDTAQLLSSSHFELGRGGAFGMGCAILLKGVPTTVSSPDGRQIVSATGTPALATGGSGDVLAGIAGTLLAQLGRADDAGALAAWLHGRAAELAQGPRSARAITLEDVLVALPNLWDEAPPPRRVPVLAELPAVREA
jgi:NAD(P)H-hydrate epimerase